MPKSKRTPPQKFKILKSFWGAQASKREKNRSQKRGVFPGETPPFSLSFYIDWGKRVPIRSNPPKKIYLPPTHASIPHPPPGPSSKSNPFPVKGGGGKKL